MKVSELLKNSAQHPVVEQFTEFIFSGANQFAQLQGFKGSGLNYLTAATFNKQPFSALFIYEDAEKAQYALSDFENLLGQQQVIYLPASFSKPWSILSEDAHQVQERAEAITKLRNTNSPKILVSWIGAIAEHLLDEKTFDKNTYQLKIGDELDLGFFSEFLYEHRFEREDFVYEPGYFAIRGGIVDVFSFSSQTPYRIELDGNTIESIRTFDPITQLSLKDIGFFTLVPDINHEQNSRKSSIFSYIPSNSIIFSEQLNTQFEGFSDAWDRLENLSENPPVGETIKPPKDIFISPDKVKVEIAKFKVLEWSSETIFQPNLIISVLQSLQPSFNKNFDLLTAHFELLSSSKTEVMLFSESAKQVERLQTIFNDLGTKATFTPVYQGLNIGFYDDYLNCAFYTEHQLFDRFYNHHKYNRFSRNAALTLKELRNLQPGDFVVHIDHGVGKFSGLQKMEVNGVMQETVRILYKDNDLLYVSVQSLHKITKYSGKDGTPPTLHKLGSATWEKQKATAKRKVKDIARELISLYARRKAKKGFAFQPDTYLQVELEAGFLYEDTPDQAKASEDVKRDMELEKPMDRLVCGDVGFGKTEVAVRAAFKAVNDSKQVAVLVPTTILAHQHFRTFSERLKGFPCNIDYLNRFKTPAEQKETIKKLAEGKVDIIIGTHRIISKDIVFKDLGLLIIDEEQKFGVQVKEKLKEIRVNVDTLTLTATPIPRTLHFSLMGARDLSIINTPPPNRQPVHTEIKVFDKKVIAAAVQFELARGGQVFFVHHRVKDIYDIKHMIEETCPGAKAIVAHGQMEGSELENAMIKFVEGEYDVLVATTIIESGLDISNANTVIINNAHMFGLSDIHQMRGRVGRSNARAFCYLLAPPLSTLSDEARKRLRTIEELNELGSGFQVAMRDLDIRGAGNMLGGEQSGFISELGFEAYHKILDEAVRELKHDEFSELFKDEKEPEILSRDCQIESDFEMLIPPEYVNNISERLSLYNELANVNNETELQLFTLSLKDRFGKIPDSVLKLLDTIRLKWVGKLLGFEKIMLGNKILKLYFPSDTNSAIYHSKMFDKVCAYIMGNGNAFSVKQSEKYLYFIAKNISTVHEALFLLHEMHQNCKD